MTETATASPREYLTGLAGPDIILQAACLFNGPFTAEDLTIQAYALAPDRFCLRGYPQLPDHHKVFAMLCGKRGLVGRDYLSKRGDRFEVTQGGINNARRVRGDRPSDKPWMDQAELGFLYPNKDELKLWRSGEQNTAIIRLIQRSHRCGRKLDAKDAHESLTLATKPYHVKNSGNGAS